MKIKFIMFLSIIFCSGSFLAGEMSVKIKDLTFLDGMKENQVFGFGIVVGLPGTGDSKSSLTRTSLKNFLKSLGMEGDEFVSKNSAAVLVTAGLPPYARIGDRIDVKVSSIGDAKSLAGGILVQSPLKGADGKIYAVAQGPVRVADVRNGRTIKTVASIKEGALVEKSITPEVVFKEKNEKEYILFVLKDPDFGVANRIVEAIKKQYKDIKPLLTGEGKIQVPVQKEISLQEFISTIENLEVLAGEKARVVINESSGTIVAGGNVKISRSMVSREGMLVQIGEEERKKAVSMIKDSSTVKELVDALNSIGASTRDIIEILKALKTAGSLHAELIIK